MTPGRTPTTTTRPSTAYHCTSSARCRRRTTLSSSPLHGTATRSSTTTASPASWLDSDAARPEKPGRKVEAEIAATLAPRWVARVVRTALTGEDPAGLRLSFGIDEDARAALETELFGKRILFSDKTLDEAPTAQIVAEYRSQECVEGDFRQKIG